MYCDKCGKENRENSKFCRSCGDAIESTNVSIEKKGETNTPYAGSEEEIILTLARGKARGLMMQGVIWFVIGLIITWVTYSFAEGGGTYFVLWGAMLIGAIQFIKCLYYWIFPGQLLKEVFKDGKNDV